MSKLIVQAISLYFFLLGSVAWADAREKCLEIEILYSSANTLTDSNSIDWVVRGAFPKTKGRIKYVPGSKTLFIDSGIGFLGGTVQWENSYYRENYGAILECLIQLSGLIENREFIDIVGTFYPAQNLCHALEYYLIDVALGRRYLKLPEYGVATRSQVGTFLEVSGVLSAWKNAISKSGFELIFVDAGWAEKYVFITVSEYLVDYGPNGKVLDNLCQNSNSVIAFMRNNLPQLRLPLFIGRIGFRVRRKD